MQTERTYAYGLGDSKSIRAAADSLILHLDQELSNLDSSVSWTAANFSALDSFPRGGPNLKRFHKMNGNEFLWDYIASDDVQGIFLVAESEKATSRRDAESFPLVHDFEKLLYVFAPLHLMICHAYDSAGAKDIAERLTGYARGCSANFPPASVFIFYCRVATGKNVSSLWQADGEPSQCLNSRVDLALSQS